MHICFAVYAAGANIQGQCGLRQGVKFTEGYERIELPFYASDVKQVLVSMHFPPLFYSNLD